MWKVLIALAILLLFSITAAFGHGSAEWIMRHSDTAYCCGPNDCFEIDKRAVRIVRSGYVFSFGGKDFQVPFEQVKMPRDEHSDEFWACFTWSNGEPAVRCFFAPPVGS